MDRFVGDSLEAFAEQWPDRPALICGDRQWTWSTLFQEVDCLSRTLVERVSNCQSTRHGLKGCRIGLRLDQPDKLLIAFFAILRSGAIAMVFDPAWPKSRSDWILRETRPEFVIDDAVYAELRRENRETAGTHPVGLIGPAPEDPFYVGFTSGSTGDPKGYCRNHRSWLKSFEVSDKEFAIGPQDHVLIPGNMVHSLHLYGAVHGLCVGATTEVTPRFNPKALAERLASQSSGVFYATPTQIHYVAEDLRRRGGTRSVRLVLASGAKWQEADRSAMKGCFPLARLVEFYGASETSFLTVSCLEERPPLGSVGRPVSGVTLSIRDDAGRPVPANTVGDIWVDSPLLFDGYVCGGGDEIRRDGTWFTIGDRGSFDDAGFLFLAGRRKRMVVTSGVNVYPEEVEQVLFRHEAVRFAAVVPRPDPVRGAVLIAYVVTEPGEEPAGDPEGEVSKDLRRHCLVFLTRAQTPREFVFLPEMPLTAGGKVDIKALEHLACQRMVADGPQTETESDTGREARRRVGP